MVNQHIESGAAVTVAGIRVPIGEASEFGVIEADEHGKIISFLEKPENPTSIPGEPDWAFASMGNYVFETQALREVVRADAEDEDSKHDMGGNIIPALVAQGTAHVYDFAENVVPGQTEREQGYWRDVGTLDAYYQANMDTIAVDPIFSYYNRTWPILTHRPPLPPAKFVFDLDDRRGAANESIVGAGVVISGGIARRSIISSDVRFTRMPRSRTRCC